MRTKYLSFEKEKTVFNIKKASKNKLIKTVRIVIGFIVQESNKWTPVNINKTFIIVISIKLKILNKANITLFFLK